MSGASAGSPSAAPLLIFPCNGNALEALDCLGSAYRLVGFVDDSPDKQGRVVFDYPVLSREELAEFPDCQVLAVPGSPTSYRERAKIIAGLGIRPERFARVVHPRASISPRARIGRNFLAMAGAVATTSSVIGDHVCMLPNSIVHHDSVVGDYTLIGAGVCIAGGVTIGENCYIGSGSSIKNGIKVGADALIGLGSTVVKDVPPGAVVAGNPARPLR